MTPVDPVALFSALISFAAIFLLIFQLYNHTEQRKLESLMQLYGINRELIGLGFAHTQLFDVLLDLEGVDPVWERRYLQLWLNQLALIHACHCRGLFVAELHEGLSIELREFMSMANMRRHWRRYGHVYPTSFRKLVDGIVQQIESRSGSAQDS